MKLDPAQLERTLGQFEARAIPDDHPVIGREFGQLERRQPVGSGAARARSDRRRHHPWIKALIRRLSRRRWCDLSCRMWRGKTRPQRNGGGLAITRAELWCARPERRQNLSQTTDATCGEP
jgi:hypothetical protein